MKNQTFPAFVFLLLGYCIGFAITALVIFPFKLFDRSTKAANTLKVSAATIAPIFEPVVLTITPKKIRKKKASISKLIVTEFDRSHCA